MAPSMIRRGCRNADGIESATQKDTGASHAEASPDRTIEHFREALRFVVAQPVDRPIEVRNRIPVPIKP